MKFISLLIVLACLCLASSARAEIVSAKTEKAVAQQSGAQDNVRANLMIHGASAEDANLMVERMSTEDLIYFESNSGRTEPGGFLLWLLAVVVLVLLIVYLAQRV